METYSINDFVNFSIVSRKSKKGNEYKAIVVQIINKDNEVVLEKQIDFLTTNQYESVLSLIKK